MSSRCAWTEVWLAALALLLMGLAGLAACGDESASHLPEPASHLPGPGAVPMAVPEPPLESMEPAVRSQLEEQRRVVRKLATDADADADAETGEGPHARELGHAFGELGRLYHAYDLFDAAAAAYRNARRLEPGEPRWPYLLALVEESRGRLEDAEATLAALLESDSVPAPALAPVLVVRGRLLVDLGSREAARESLERAVEIEPDHAAALFELGRLAAEEGDAASAAKLFERVLELQPQASLVHYPLAQAYRKLGRPDEARAQLERRGNERVAAADPWLEEVHALASGSAAHRALGGFAWREGRLEDAVAEYRRAVEADPASIVSRRDLAFVLAQAGHVDEALGELRVAAEARPDNALLHHATGVLESQRGDLAAARKTLERAVVLDPGYEDARWDLAQVLAGLDRPAEAAAQLEAVLAINPNRQEARKLRAVVLARAGRLEEAEAELERAVAADPEDVELRLELARLAEHLGHAALALEQRRAVAALATSQEP